MSVSPLRWDRYHIEKGPAVQTFWQERRRGGRTLLVMGLGFDPRTALILEILVAAGSGPIDVRLLHFDEGPDSVSQKYAKEVAANEAAVRDLVAGVKGTVVDIHVPMVEEDRRVGGRRVGNLATHTGLGGYVDVIVDISALPRALYFPLIRTFLRHVDSSQSGANRETTNLHVALSESPTFDASVREQLTERAEFLPGFLGTVELEQDEDMPRVWAPVLGEQQSEALKLIEQKARVLDNAPEICPVLPFPALDPRRGDRLLLEYRGLFDSWRVDPRNIIYASEHNPFDVYRQLCALYDRYSRALKPLRGAKMIISAHSSKLLSLGALLAACDRPEVAVAYVEAQGYQVEGPLTRPVDAVPFGIWVAGEPYHVPED
jgi:hypothetical protein